MATSLSIFLLRKEENSDRLLKGKWRWKMRWKNVEQTSKFAFFAIGFIFQKTSNKDFRAKKKVLTHLNPMSHKRKKVFGIQQKLNLWTNWMQIKLKIEEGSFFKKSVIFLLFLIEFFCSTVNLKWKRSKLSPETEMQDKGNSTFTVVFRGLILLLLFVCEKF